ncbi:MAG: hypothetical protein GQF41_1719 [Candidatus Rifleibacterium amylolyticum]|nr:MAG: hypothetical protein GQF41_1719 [Candidatus Rifleibacterium amylolyticum]
MFIFCRQTNAYACVLNRLSWPNIAKPENAACSFGKLVSDVVFRRPVPVRDNYGEKAAWLKTEALDRKKINELLNTVKIPHWQI